MRILDTTQTLSLAASGSATSVEFESHFGYCLFGVVTGGTAAGTASLYISNDNVTFELLPKSTITIAGAGNCVWEFSSSRHQYAQVQFVRTSGTGSMAIAVEGKGF